MAITWLWRAQDSSHTEPAVSDQLQRIGKHALCLRNPLINDAALMGRMYSASFIFISLYISWNSNLALYYNLDNKPYLFLIQILLETAFPLLLIILILDKIYTIKTQTNYYFNRHTRKIYFRKRKMYLSGDWNKVQGGMNSRLAFTGAAFATSHYLLIRAFGNDPDSEQACMLKKSWSPVYAITIDSNAPGDPRAQPVAEVWEYIRLFMEKGPDALPPPLEPNWWNIPENSIYLTPRQALRHYVPWRTGEPGERWAKRWWTLPFFVVLFPYNMFLSLSWWATCRLFNVRPGEPPAEVFEGETGPMISYEEARQGIRP